MLADRQDQERWVCSGGAVTTMKRHWIGHWPWWAKRQALAVAYLRTMKPQLRGDELGLSESRLSESNRRPVLYESTALTS